jgi:hypothetical protein
MSRTLDPVGAAPDARSASFIALLFACTAAPIFWLGQTVLAYGVTAQACYPGDHPQPMAHTAPLTTAMIVFDIVALGACAAGALVAWTIWRRVREAGGHRHTLHTGEGRNRFLAMWGLLSSLWFFGAILFNVIASLVVPPCLF